MDNKKIMEEVKMKEKKFPRIRWRDKHKNVTFEFTFLPVDEIKIPPIQRDLSNSLVGKIFQSIEKVGFIVPPVVFKASDGSWYVIDGQHRLKAAQMAGYQYIPVIVIPKEYAQHILTFNVEKPSNLKDKAKQAYKLYKEFLDKFGDEIIEDEVTFYIDYPYYVTVGIVINEIYPKFSGSMFESFLKKVDVYPMDKPLSESYEIRKKMAKELYDVYELINEIYNETGLKNALVKGEIFRKTFQSVYGKRVRTIEDDYFTAIEKIKKYLIEHKTELINEFSENLGISL